MIKKHLHSALDAISVSPEQKKQLLELLAEIKRDEQLLLAFNRIDEQELLTDIASETSEGGTLLFSDSLSNEHHPSPPDGSQSAHFEGVETLVGDLDFSEEFKVTTPPSSPQATETLFPSEIASDNALDDALGFETMAPDDFGTEETEIELSTLGRYLDLGLLGRGGMGEIRKVKDLVLNRELAMKIVHSDILSNKNAMARFIEEAQIGAQLQHPNVVPVYELGTLPDGRYYFTMKEIKGREFTDLIQSVHKASSESLWKDAADGTTFRRLIQIFHQMCETMAFAHSLGVIHRDLKPENVMIGDYGEVLVVDWGIAKVLGQTSDEIENFVQTSRSEYNIMATRMGMIAGTPSYMSPEQAKGSVHRVNVQSDVYTLGAILYEILSGKPPYSGTTAIEIVEKVRKTRPPSLFTTGQGSQDPTVIPDASSLEEMDSGKIPLPLIRICERAMEREIKDRYPSAAELASEILGWLEGAQKRDKALKEVEEALQMRQAALEKEANYAERWAAANHNIQHNGFETEANWSEWNQAQRAWQDAQQLRREHRKKLQGALVYAPDLEEANEALAKLLLEDIVVAIANGERQTREILERQFNKHLQYLSTKGQQTLRSLLQRKRSDNILLLRARRGTLVGRRTLRSDIAKVLKNQSRLVSLVGTAGVGKTRLALEVIYDLQEPSTSTYFCDLTEAATELGVALAVAKSMNVKLRNVDPIGQLGELFEQQQTILVLDNLEQVVEPIGVVVTRWMEQSNSLRIIATSRVKLRLAEEHSFPVEPLTMLEGMELFGKRGQQAEPSFNLCTKTRQSIGRLISQLDNLPLAIELAAARLNIFNVDEIEQRLTERFSLLRSRSKGTQALQGALDWSWDLLKPWAKAALTQSSVFRGGFEITAAENIVQCGEWKESPPVFDILQDLCDDSLLLQNKSSEGEVRFGLLESIRQYARKKLSDNDSIAQGLSGPQANTDTEGRHARYYAQFGTPSFLESLDSRGTQGNWTSFSEELDNFVAGIDYGAGDVALHCCMAALKILGMKGPVSLGVDIAADVIRKPDTSPRAKKQLQILRMKFLRISGRMNEARSQRDQQQPTSLKESVSTSPSQTDNDSVSIASTLSQPVEETDLKLKADDLLEQGNLEEAEALYDHALQLYEQALNIYIELDDKKGRIEARRKVGIVLRRQGKYDRALAELNTALQLAERDRFFLLEAKIHSTLGNLHDEKGDLQLALQHHQRSLHLDQQVNNQFGVAASLGNLGLMYQGLGQHEQAIEYFERALQLATQIGDKRTQGLNLGNLGGMYLDLGHYEKAITYLKQTIAVAQQIGDKRTQGNNYGSLGNVYSALGQYEESIRCYKRSIEIAQQIGNKRSEGIYLGNVGSVYQDLKQYQRAIEYYKRSIQIAKELGNPRSEGINLGNTGDVLILLGKWEEAKQHLQAAVTICTTVIPSIAGAFMGSLAWVELQLGNTDQSLALLEEGEPLVSVYPLEYGKFLCKKAKLFHTLKQFDSSEAAIAKAEGLALELKMTDDSELGVAITEAKNVLRSTEHQLVEDLDEEIEDRRLEADELLEQGNIEEAEAFYDTALELYNQALHIYEEIHHPKGVVEARQKMGVVYYQQSKHNQALTELHVALDLTKAHRFLELKARIYSSLGNVYWSTGQSEQALLMHRQALEINQNIGNRVEEAKNLGNLGLVLSNLKKNEEAISHLQKSIALSEQIGDKRHVGIYLGNLGGIYYQLNQLDEAIQYYQRAVDIAREIEDKRTEGLSLGNLGDIFIKVQRWTEAKQSLAPSILICKTTLPLAAGAFMGSLAWVELQLGNTDQSLALLEEGEPLVSVYPPEYGKFLCKKAKILHLLRQPKEAEQALLQATTISEHLNSIDPELQSLLLKTAEFLRATIPTV